MEKLCCKVCGRCFLSPRLLGVHMRSHVILKSEEEPMCRYGFRENPKKSWKLKEKEKDMLSTKCIEGFGSCSIFSSKHMKCHSEMTGDDLSVEDNEKDEELEEKEKALKSNGRYEEGEDRMLNQSDSEVTTVVFPASRRQRKKRKSLDSLLEYDNEQKEGAFCLMMLSRGIGPVTDSTGKVSVVTDKEVKKKRSDSGFPKFDFQMNEPRKHQPFPNYNFAMNELKKVQSFPSKSEFSPEPKKSKALLGNKFLNSVVSEPGKRGRYKYTTCNKSFHSYQAHGGQRASHKKIKASFFSQIPATDELNIQNHGFKSTKNTHECSICGKIFASGQALGGHKKSHSVPADYAVSSDAVQTSHPVIEIK